MARPPIDTEIKKAIFSTAQQLFARHGLHGASIGDIAAQAQTAKSTVLHHYPTKLKLYQAVLHESFGKISELLGRHVDAVNPPERLKLKLKRLLHWMLGEPVHARLLNRVFLDNPKAAPLAAKKYWLPLMAHLTEEELPHLAREKSQVMTLVLVNSLLQMAFSLELQVLLFKEVTGSDDLIGHLDTLIDELVTNFAA